MEQDVTLTGSGFTPASRARIYGEGRSTTYVSSTTLVLQLEEDDVADAIDLAITVVNDPPGGGYSDPLVLAVVWETPTISDISPDTVVGGHGAVPLTVYGSGFRQGVSYVFVGLDQYDATVLSPSELATSIPPMKTAVAGEQPVKVYHYPTENRPEQESGTLPLMILNPAPVLSSMSPTTVVVGRPTRVSLTGSLFHGSSQVFWDGNTYPTHVASASLLYADLPAEAFETAGAASMAVRTPGPGGGTSSALTLMQVVSPPRITGFTPSTAQAGGSGFSLTIHGRHFSVGSTLAWNGIERTTTVANDSTIAVSVSASDLVDAGSAMLRVVRPDDQESPMVGFPILEAASLITDSVTVELLTTDLVAHPTGSAIYAVVRNFANEYRNEVLAFDTSTGDILWHLPVGRGPRVIAISDDAAYLFVGYLGVSTITRIHVPTRRIDLEIPLLDQSPAADIAVFPSQPTTIGIAQRNAAVWIYDGAVPRPLHGFGNQVEVAPNRERVYGHGGHGFAFFRHLMTANGLIEDGSNTLLSNGNVTITYDSGLIFASNGRVMDPEANTLLGTLPDAGYVRPDVANGRVHRLAGSTMTTYHISTFEVLGSLDIGSPHVGKMVRFGKDGMAFGAGDHLVLIRSPLIG